MVAMAAAQVTAKLMANMPGKMKDFKRLIYLLIKWFFMIITFGFIINVSI